MASEEVIGGSQFKDNYFTEMCSGSEAGSYLRFIDFFHSTLGLRVITKKREALGWGVLPATNIEQNRGNPKHRITLRCQLSDTGHFW